MANSDTLEKFKNSLSAEQLKEFEKRVHFTLYHGKGNLTKENIEFLHMLGMQMEQQGKISTAENQTTNNVNKD